MAGLVLMTLKEKVHMDDNILKYANCLLMSQSSHSMDDVLGKVKRQDYFTLTADDWQKRQRHSHQGRNKQDVEQQSTEEGAVTFLPVASASEPLHDLIQVVLPGLITELRLCLCHAEVMRHASFIHLCTCQQRLEVIEGADEAVNHFCEEGKKVNERDRKAQCGETIA